MRRPFSIADLEQTGLILSVDEALAVTQQLINTSEPGGRPSNDSVFIDEDGRITCTNAETPMTLSDIGAFLQALLPSPIAVSGSLRYAIARAVGDVEAPPFESLEEFSRTLARFERDDRPDIIRGLTSRAFHGLTGAVPVVERRRSAPRAAELRRHLREADQRLYDQQLALRTVGAMAPTDSKPVRRLAVTVVAVGMTLSAAAAFAHWRSHDADPAGAVSPVSIVDRREAVISEPALSTHVPIAEPLRTPDPAADQKIVTAVPSAAEKPVAKRDVSRRPANATRARSEKPRWHWLRGRIAFRADPL